MNIEKMETLAENLKQRASIQVGVFESKSARESGKFTNADLAAIHEYGSPEHNLPPRSMLHVPIAEHSSEIMAPFKGKAEQFLIKGKLKNLYDLIGFACEKVVLGAFETGGYGKWAPLKSNTIWRKLKGSLASKANKFWNIKAGNTGMGILIDTGQLRRAFKSRVIMIR